ncbi:glyoxalase/bleomycin resistance/dioxygenase family protein [Yinghuangia aomiensis]|uniref:Glyoxalase/bleomycin resistance/dioxygenase family protein n=1 Tax=Yinghuangia aomiensis TaxID=676205 RepID=A0ABP9H1D9_9ACTN
MIADAPLTAVVPVTDRARAVAFYRDKLGIPVKEEHAEDITFTCGGTQFSLYETPYGGQAQHTLASWKVDDLDAAMKDLRGRGVVFEDYDFPGLKTVNGVAESPEGGRAAWFRDSEGNVLCVAQGM